MEEVDKRDFSEALANLGKLFPKSPDFKDRLVLKMWWGVFTDIPLKDFLKACQHALTTQEWFPPPATLKRFCKEVYETDEDIGLDTANRIENAVGSYGYMNHKGAREYIGERGWKVVEQLGGWTRVCDIESFDQMPSLRANWRKLATLDAKRVNTQGENKPSALPKSFSGSLSATEVANRLIGAKLE